MLPFRQEAGDELDAPFVFVVEGSIPNENINGDGYWTSFGNDPATGEPLTLHWWIESWFMLLSTPALVSQVASNFPLGMDVFTVARIEGDEDPGSPPRLGFIESTANVATLFMFALPF